MILTYIGWILVIIGIAFIGSGIMALFRFQGFYNKLHGAGVIDSCGIPLCLLGLILMQNNYAVIFKLCLIIILIFLLTPLSTHALARASLPHHKIQLQKIPSKRKIK